MVKSVFLAVTASEFQGIRPFAGNIAWMACHFSQSGPGLANLPAELPPGSLLILNDRLPPRGHSPELIADQLAQTVEQFSCTGVLLDLERPGSEETAALVRPLIRALPKPPIVSSAYAEGLCCPVFLPPLPPDTPLVDYLSPWQGRELWLEAALGGQRLTLSEGGLARTPLAPFEVPETGLTEEVLLCHYRITEGPSTVQFDLWRTPKDLQKLLEQAHDLGISAVGLYRELAKQSSFSLSYPPQGAVPYQP